MEKRARRWRAATLTGGAVTSTQQAIDEQRNRFETGGSLTLADIQNQAEYTAKSASVSLGAGTSFAGKLIPGGSSAGVGQDSGKAESMTLAAISGIAGNTQARTGDKETGIGRIFDAEKVQKEITAQGVITQSFGQQASQAVGDYVQAQKQTLREAYKNALDAERAAIQAQFDDLILQERVMNVLIGAVTGLSGSALAKETLALAGDEMQRISVENSMRSPGFVDAYGNVLTNLRRGEKDKLRQDIDLAGTRLDPDGICGPGYERCVKQVDADGKLLLDANGKPQLAYNAEGRMQFTYKPDGQEVSIYDFLANTDEGKKMHGITGGIQGGKATFMGYAYPPGGVVDRVFKAFGGEHDYIGGQATGLYDGQGNIRQGMTGAERTSYNTWSAVAIAPSAPFAMVELIPPEMWKAISILLGAAK